ncbi:MAG: molybdopterin-containing oxidoreductase family protein, partial [Conexivisphaera sp.]
MSKAVAAFPGDEVRTTCRWCLNYCGIVVRKDGGALRIRGDPSHPLSRGFLCAKGLSSLDIALSPRRILHPMRRVGERGEGRWAEVSWDEALSDIASRLREIIEDHGPDAVAVESLPPKDYLIWEAFARAIGTTTFFKHDAHQCFTPQMIVDYVTFGALVSYPNMTREDAEHVRTLVLWGVNPTATNPSKGAVFDYALRRGARLVVVDPRPIPFARRADVWLRVRPGSDAALAMGMINYLLSNDLYNREFVERWTSGIDELRRRVSKYTLERVAELAWVEPGDVRRAAELMAMNGPTAVYTFIGLVMNGNGFRTLRALDILIALLGYVDVRGGNAIKLPPKTVKRGFEGENIFRLPRDALLRQISAAKYPLLAGPGAITPYPHPWDVLRAIEEGRVRALLTDSNPVAALEDGTDTLRVLEKLDLLVTLELFMTPTAEISDYVLPLTTFLETDEVTMYTGLNFVSARSKVIEPVGEARGQVEILLEILRRMGLSDALPFRNRAEYLDFILHESGHTFEDLRSMGHLMRPYEERKYERGLLRADGSPGFPTGDGKIRLWAPELDGDDLHAEPPYSPYSTPELLERYPFVACTGVRYLESYNGLGLHVDKLRRSHPDPSVELSPGAAGKLGLTDGSWAYVSA